MEELGIAIADVCWAEIFRRLSLVRAEQSAIDELRERARDLKNAAEKARDLSFEIDAVQNYWGPGEPLLPRLVPYYDALQRAWENATRPSAQFVVDSFVRGSTFVQTLRYHLKGADAFDLNTAPADQVRQFGLALRNIADNIEAYLESHVLRYARGERAGDDGPLPQLAPTYLVNEAKAKNVGLFDVARAIRRLGIDLDAPIWLFGQVPPNRDPDETDIRGLANRLGEILRRRRQAGRKTRSTNRDS